jgi:hypothetical protein
MEITVSLNRPVLSFPYSRCIDTQSFEQLMTSPESDKSGTQYVVLTCPNY